MWSSEKILEFIQMFQSKELLWNPSNKDYHMISRKEEAWQDIANSIDMDVADLKSKMISLSSSFRRENAKIKASRTSGSGTGEVYTPTWFAYEAMSFLNDREKLRKRRHAEAQKSEVEDIKSEIVHNPDSPATETLFATPVPHPSSRPAKRNTNHSLLSEALDDFTSEDAPSPNVETEDYETFHFANYLACKMRKYDTHTKNAVQRGIMELIFKADEGFYTMGQDFSGQM